jgi:hypothetical protein
MLYPNMYSSSPTKVYLQTNWLKKHANKFKGQRYNIQEFWRFFEINLLYCTVHTSGKNQHIILSQLRLAQNLVSAIPP